MRDLMGMMKQAKQLQSKIQEMQEQVAALVVTGSAGGGLVTVSLGGKGEMKSLKIDASLIRADEAEILEDLILAAHNDARVKLEEKSGELAQGLTGGLASLGLPGGKLPF